MKLVARAPGKVNLCLFLGPLRDDGRHEVVTLLESVSLADEVTVSSAPAPAPAPSPPDQVVCADVPGVNIVSQTLDGLRARGWDAPPLRVVIDKRIPVAGGMGGGSADAAALLRMAPAIAPVAATVIDELAASLGADVPSQLRPGLFLGTGAGEVVEHREPVGEHAFVIVPQGFGLSTAEVYREADRLGVPRDASDLAHQLRAVRAGGMPQLINDLQAAALSLRPEIGRALEAVRDAGAEHAMVSGSGPTVFGLLFGADAEARASDAVAGLSDRYPGATAAAPVSEDFGAPRGS
ncbi:MAG: 4-(cytidine 5'-diphospho)-2-C-methyl-D-erythritol kinase [Solirubrobacteraceae bacterium]